MVCVGRFPSQAIERMGNILQQMLKDQTSPSTVYSVPYRQRQCFISTLVCCSGQASIIVYQLHFLTQEGKRLWFTPGLPKIYNQCLCFVHTQEVVTVSTPCQKMPHQFSVLRLPSPRGNSTLIWAFLYMTSIYFWNVQNWDQKQLIVTCTQTWGIASVGNLFSCRGLKQLCWQRQISPIWRAVCQGIYAIKKLNT